MVSAVEVGKSIFDATFNDLVQFGDNGHEVIEIIVRNGISVPHTAEKGFFYNIKRRFANLFCTEINRKTSSKYFRFAMSFLAVNKDHVVEEQQEQLQKLLGRISSKANIPQELRTFLVYETTKLTRSVSERLTTVKVEETTRKTFTEDFKASEKARLEQTELKPLHQMVEALKAEVKELKDARESYYNLLIVCEGGSTTLLSREIADRLKLSGAPRGPSREENARYPKVEKVLELPRASFVFKSMVTLRDESHESLADLYRVGVELEIPELKHNARNVFLSKKMTTGFVQCLRRLNLDRKDELVQEILTQLAENLAKEERAQGYFSNLRPDEIRWLLKMDYIQGVARESDLFEIVLRWASANSVKGKTVQGILSEKEGSEPSIMDLMNLIYISQDKLKLLKDKYNFISGEVVIDVNNRPLNRTLVESSVSQGSYVIKPSFNIRDLFKYQAEFNIVLNNELLKVFFRTRTVDGRPRCEIGIENKGKYDLNYMHSHYVVEIKDISSFDHYLDDSNGVYWRSYEYNFVMSAPNIAFKYS